MSMLSKYPKPLDLQKTTMTFTLIYDHNHLREAICFLTVLFDFVLPDIFGLFTCNPDGTSANIPPLQNRKRKDPPKTRYASRDK